MDLRRKISGVICPSWGIGLALFGATAWGSEAWARSDRMSEALKIFSGVGDLRKGGGANSIVSGTLGIVMFGVAILAVAVVIWGGIQYMLSAGDAGKVKTAKNKIFYGLLGLIVTIFAYAIVNFVTTKAGGMV